jgi:hypothetical protein
VVFLCNAGQGHPSEAVSNDFCTVNVERRTTNSSAFQFRSTHSSPDALDNERALQLGNRTDNHDYRTAQRASRVDIFAQADELDVEVAQFVEHFQEMADTPCHSIESSNEHDIEAMPPSIHQQLIEARSFRSGTGNNACVFVRNFVSALLCHFAEVVKLRLRMLVRG